MAGVPNGTIYERFSDSERATLRKYRPIDSVGPFWIFECPVRLIDQDSVKMMEACFLISESNIPFWPGAWIDQPAWLVQAYQIYTRELALIRKENIDKIKQ